MRKGDNVKSIEEIKKKIEYLERLIERSRSWEYQNKATKLFRDILDAEINQLKWVLNKQI